VIGVGPEVGQVPARLVGLDALHPHQAREDQGEPVPVEPRQAGQQPDDLAGAHLAVLRRCPQGGAAKPGVGILVALGQVQVQDHREVLRVAGLTP
jgi:hypothetical protein